MASESSKSSPWTSVSVKGNTAAAVWAMQQSYMRRHGRPISQDLVVATALSHIKVADLPPPPKKTGKNIASPLDND
jgi:hypothetical protein